MAKFKYKQLVEQIKNDILASVFIPGQQIPIEDELMERFALSRNTVRQAINLLAEEGYVVKIQGSGTFVSEKLPSSKKRENTSRRIGVMMNHVNAYIFPRLLLGISDYLFENDYSLVIRHTFNHIAKEEQALIELLDANLDGLIIEPARSGLPRVNYDLYRKIEDTIPCVLLHAELAGFQFPSVRASDADGFVLLVDNLVQKGHTNIAAFCKFDEQTGVQRFIGFAKGLRKNGLNFEEDMVLWLSDEDVESFFSEANAHRILSFIENRTAIMCHNDELAERFCVFLQKHGISIPDALSVVGFDDSMKGGMVPPVTTILHPKGVLGRAAGKAILDLIADPSADVSVRPAPELIDHGTVKTL